MVVEQDYQVSDSRYNFEGQRGARELIRCPHCIEATERRVQGQDSGKAGWAQGSGIENA